jgi:hypothetical protein
LPILSASTSNSRLCFGQTCTLTANGAVSYSWNPGGLGTSLVISPTVTTNYSVTGTDINGCINNSIITQSVSVCNNIQKLTEINLEVSLSPNPTRGTFNVYISKPLNNVNIELFNSLGGSVYLQKKINELTTIDLSSEPDGIYFVKLTQDNTIISSKKILKQ